MFQPFVETGWVTSIGITDPMGYVISVVLVVMSVPCMWLSARAMAGKDYHTEQRGGGLA
jgi:iron(III) transport system permease protein